jgi:hypothetical protein
MTYPMSGFLAQTDNISNKDTDMMIQNGINYTSVFEVCKLDVHEYKKMFV